MIAVRDARGLLIFLAIVLAVAGGLWWWSRPRPVPEAPPPPEPAESVRFHKSGLAVRSPELAVGSAELRATVHPGYTAWRVEVGCAEAVGCAGEFTVEVRYATGQDGEGRVVLRGSCDVPSGGAMVFEGLQDPPAPVAGIELVTLEVRSRGSAGGEVEVPL